MKSVRLRITGRVQGVFYRGWTVDAANARGLNGWVRNRADGSVEALVSGEDAEVDDLIAACWNGPPAARVEGIEITPADRPDEKGFRQVATR